MKRVGAALLAGAVLFAVDASAAGLRPCPHHDHVPAQQSDHHSHSSPDATPDTPGHDDGPCSCLSGAQCSVPAALPQSNATALMAAAAVTHSAAARLVHQTAARSPHLFLPEATAPPVVL